MDAGGKCRTQKDIADEIKAWKNEEGNKKTYEQIAEILDVSRKTAARICRGETSVSLREAKILAPLMGKPVEFFDPDENYDWVKSDSNVCSVTQPSARGTPEQDFNAYSGDLECEDAAEIDRLYQEFIKDIIYEPDPKVKLYLMNAYRKYRTKEGLAVAANR